MNVNIRELSIEERRALWEWSQDTLIKPLINHEAPSYENHSDWFSKKINSQHEYWFVGLSQALRLGIIRFKNVGPKEFDIKILIKPMYCGKGYSKIFLEQSIIALKGKTEVKKITYFSKYYNNVTKNIFINSGFTTTLLDDAIFCELFI